MLRLMRKWDTIKEYVPGPEIFPCGEKTDVAVLVLRHQRGVFREALDYLAEEGCIGRDACTGLPLQ